VVVAAALGRLSGMGLVLGPLLAIPVALAGIGAPTPRLPLACGALMLAAAVVLASDQHGGAVVAVAHRDPDRVHLVPSYLVCPLYPVKHAT
jgi:hypothetical protein